MSEAFLYAKNPLSRWIEKKIITHLVSELRFYERNVFNNPDNVKKYLKPGDVILVEGRQRISHIIKLLTNSTWSHSAYYVGDYFVRTGMPLRDYYFEKYGEWANHMIVEANTGEGVTVNSIIRYMNYNLRCCRPFGITENDLIKVTEKIVSHLGFRYDNKNIIELAMMLIPFQVNPFRTTKLNHYLGSGNEYEVICSGMIAKAFHDVGFPILPHLDKKLEQTPDFNSNVFGAPLTLRHYSQIIPRDFDLSPNFSVVKFNIIETGKFDYKKLTWTGADEGENGDQG